MQHIRLVLALLVILAVGSAGCAASVELGLSGNGDQVAVPDNEADPTEPSEPDPTPTPRTDPTPEPDPDPDPDPEPEATPEPEPTPDDEPTPEPQPVDPSNVVTPDRYEWESAGCEIEAPPGYDMACGWLTAPEIWEDPDNTGTVLLHTALVTDPDASSLGDTMVYLEGGPGGDALNLLSSSFADTWALLAEDQPILFYSQRGSAGSEPHLDCPEVEEADLAAAEDPDLDEGAVSDAYQACAERLESEGVNFAAFSSVQSAHDLEALRQVVNGDAPWNLVGVSYGTRLGQTLMRLHPDGVRAMVLDAVVPNQAAIYADIPRNADRAFTELFAACAEDPACDDRWPDLEERYWAVADAMDADPITVRTTNSFTGTAHEVVLNGDDLAGLTFSALYSADALAAIPELVEQVESGELAGLSMLASLSLVQSGFLAEGMLNTVACNEELPFHTAEDWEAGLVGAPEILERVAGDNYIEDSVEACSYFAGEVVDPVEDEPIVSDIPTLLLSGQFDPITPEVNALAMLDGLTNATAILLPNTGHGAVATECGQQMIAEFLVTLEAPDQSCLASVPAVDWQSDPLVDAELEVAVVETFLDPLSAAVPASWSESDGGIFYANTNLLHQTGLVMQNTGALGYELFADQFLGFLGGGVDPVVVDPFTDDQGRQWDHQVVDSGGFVFDAFGINDDGNGFVIVLQSAPADREALLAQLMPDILSSVAAT